MTLIAHNAARPGPADGPIGRGAEPVLRGDWFAAGPGVRSGVHDLGAAAAALVDAPALDGLPAAPHIPGRKLPNSVGFARDQGGFLFPAVHALGEVPRLDVIGGPRSVVILSNPAHIRALMTTDPALAPSATRRSPLRPIVGPDSVLTSIGDRHRQQRALLLPQFHGRAVAAYRERIEDATRERLDAWPVGEWVRSADLAQQITLDVIMTAVFGIATEADASAAERRLRSSMIRLLTLSAKPVALLAQFVNARSEEPVGLTRLVLRPLDRAIAEVIGERRAESVDDAASRADILSVLLHARTEAGAPLGDGEIRDELLTLVLAGHETTSNTVAWTLERLTRNPDVLAAAREAAAAGDQDHLDAVIDESMRNRPVVPIVARELLTPWRFGGYRVEAGVVALVSILLLHHRDDLYPDPFAFRPERFVGVRPASHTLLPFGGGNRRCLGATLAMAELKVVLREILLRLDLETTDRPAERPRHRNVTMIPFDGGLVRARARD